MALAHTAPGQGSPLPSPPSTRGLLEQALGAPGHGAGEEGARGKVMDGGGWKERGGEAITVCSIISRTSSPVGYRVIK